MQIIENYADLLRKIEVIKLQIEMFEGTIDYWMGKGPVPFQSTGADKHGLDAAARNTDRAVDRLKNLEKMLEFYSDLQQEIETSINSLEGLEYKISYMRFIENKTYKEIAEELDYSYGYIRNVVANIKRHDNDVTQHKQKG